MGPLQDLNFNIEFRPLSLTASKMFDYIIRFGKKFRMISIKINASRRSSVILALIALSLKFPFENARSASAVDTGKVDNRHNRFDTIGKAVAEHLFNADMALTGVDPRFF